MEELEKLESKYILSYCEIPENIRENHWISEYMSGCFVEVHIPDEDEDEEEDLIQEWIMETYPFLKDEESFLIEIDY